MGFMGIWDLFIGALSVGLAAPVIMRIVNSQLPTQRLVILTTVFEDTDALLTSCVEQGLIKEPSTALFHSRIEQLRERVLVARLQALGAKNYYEDFYNMCGGLSFRMRKVYNDVRALRAKISTTSLGERERLAAEHRHTGGVSPVANYDTRAPQLTTHATQSSGVATVSSPPAITTHGHCPSSANGAACWHSRA
ncbi:hypothetical protein BD413DRAFT_35312 [Trametes elegans]|nr:hypothetical protein BD413DRAFT_35312 [Trametes elegans]